MNETITKELLDGVLLWNFVSFAEMPEYQSDIRKEEINITFL